MTKNDGRDPRTGRFVGGNAFARKTGMHQYLAKGKLPSIRGKRALKKHLQEIQVELESNTPNLNIKRRILVSQIVRTETILKLIETFVKAHGVLRPDKYKNGLLELHPSLATSYLSFLTAQKNAIVALGLDEGQAEKL